ncbi:MAG TPA: tetratricopeptide repeat protein [Allosphingosinicella sp.]|uniref:tetratricopeptide repeat protein n=1 Tax=Allosphingosinicella sp. TaxID=2823234 RepID=UPI002ED94EA2
MISFLLALAAAAQAAPQGEEAQFKACAALVKSDPQKALSTANEWRIKGGGIVARQCLGLAYVELGRWAPAAVSFEQAARDAERANDPRRADFWVQSGNAWLAAEDGAKAKTAFDAALATNALSSELRGEVHLDRARAAVATGDLKSARTDIDRALQLVAKDPFAWYLSAGLALREGNMAKANADIGKAVELAPDNADVLLYAGTIAGTSGDIASAKDYYVKVVKIAPGTDAAKSAQAALDAAAEPPEPVEAEEEE